MVPAAFVYALAARHVPIAFVTVFLTYLFGVLAGVIVVRGENRFGIRNVIVAGMMGFVLFLVGYIVHWPAYVAVLQAHWGGDAFNIAWIVQRTIALLEDPAGLMALIREIMAEGTWSLGYDSSATVHGMQLVGVWAAEALLFLVVAVNIPVRKARSPYSEKKGMWIKEEEMKSPVSYIEDKGAFMNAMARRDYDALMIPAPNHPAQKGFARVLLYLDDPETYVTVTNVRIKRNAQGRQIGKTERNVVKYMAVDNATAEEIRAKLSTATAVS